jgi:hypothetical protein
MSQSCLGSSLYTHTANRASNSCSPCRCNDSRGRVVVNDVVPRGSLSKLGVSVGIEHLARSAVMWFEVILGYRSRFRNTVGTPNVTLSHETLAHVPSRSSRLAEFQVSVSARVRVDPKAGWPKARGSQRLVTGYNAITKCRCMADGVMLQAEA